MYSAQCILNIVYCIMSIVYCVGTQFVPLLEVLRALVSAG